MAFKGTKVQKVMVQPINLIFRYLQNRSRVSIWLYDQVNIRIEGHIVGFDEYMNLVLDEGEEVHIKKHSRKTLGRIMLKGDNITVIQQVQETEGSWMYWLYMKRCSQMQFLILECMINFFTSWSLSAAESATLLFRGGLLTFSFQFVIACILQTHLFFVKDVNIVCMARGNLEMLWFDIL